MVHFRDILSTNQRGELIVHCYILLRRVYSQVNVERPASYWDYENIEVSWG